MATDKPALMAALYAQATLEPKPMLEVQRAVGPGPAAVVHGRWTGASAWQLACLALTDTAIFLEEATISGDDPGPHVSWLSESDAWSGCRSPGQDEFAVVAVASYKAASKNQEYDWAVQITGPRGAPLVDAALVFLAVMLWRAFGPPAAPACVRDLLRLVDINGGDHLPIYSLPPPAAPAVTLVRKRSRTPPRLVPRPMCLRWAKGMCNAGKKCKYAHIDQK